MEYKFVKPEYLKLLWFCGAMTLYWLVNLIIRIRSRPDKTRFSKFSLLGETKTALCIILFLSGLAVALARPYSVITLPTENKINFFLIDDYSFSGLATDIGPTRFVRAKLEIKRFIKNFVRNGDRTGLAVVGRGVGIKTYLSEDASDLLIKLNAMEIDMEDADTWSTNIFFGLKTIADAYEKQSKYDSQLSDSHTRNVFLFFSDGDDSELTDTDPEKQKMKVDTLKRLHDLGIPVYVVGVGTTGGATVKYVPKKEEGVSTSDDDKVIEIKTRLQEKTLREISSMTGGDYFAINNSSVSTEQFFKKIVAKERKYGVRDTKTEEQELYHYVLIGCAGMLLFTILIL